MWQIVKVRGWWIAICILLSGCVTQAEKPDPAEAAIQAEQAQPSAELPSLDAFNEAIEGLEARITATQDNLLNVHGLTALQNERLQAIQVQLQILAQRSNQPASQNGEPAGGESLQEMQYMLDQLALAASEVSNAVDQGSYQMTSAYTQAGHWVLIRYDRVTGETWLADSGAWKVLSETQSLPLSQYEVHLQRADKDLKGFVAARIDKRTGESWWLNQNVWEGMEP